MFAEQFNISLEYQKRFAEADGFKQSADEFFSNPQVIGANITMPFKDDALQYANTLSSQAQRAGAVNTLIRKENGFIGDNTDGYGLVTDLMNNSINLNDSTVLLIGAGGAAKGVVPALVDAKVKRIDIYNRSANKAVDLCEYTNKYSSNTTQVYDARYVNTYDLIINATSLSLQHNLPDISDDIFITMPAVYDMVYLNKPTAFLAHAKSLGCNKCIDGLGMLVNQAARSFELWFHKTPDTAPVLEYLRAQLK